jgi:16S rRNA (cytidine1402-2'-O)-methyltransferase
VVTPEEAAVRVRAREQAGEPRRTAIAAVASEHGLPRRVVYNAVVAGADAVPTRMDDPLALSRRDAGS